MSSAHLQKRLVVGRQADDGSRQADEATLRTRELGVSASWSAALALQPRLSVVCLRR